MSLFQTFLSNLCFLAASPSICGDLREVIPKTLWKKKLSHDASLSWLTGM